MCERFTSALNSYTDKHIFPRNFQKAAGIGNTAKLESRLQRGESSSAIFFAMALLIFDNYSHFREDIFVIAWKCRKYDLHLCHIS